MSAAQSPRGQGVALAALAGGLLVGAFLLHERHNLNHDVASFLYAARLLLDGATLYRDFVDHNLPLSSQSLIPVIWLTDGAGLPITWALSLYMLAWTTLSWALCLVMLRRWDGNFSAAAWATIVLLAGFAYLPGYSFGQREHMFTVLVTPYLFAVVARACGTPVPVWLAVTVGAMAGIGIGLKPHLGAIPFAMEMVLLARRRELRALIRPETIAAAVTIAMLAAQLFLAHPEWLSKVVPRTLETYGAYNDFTTLTVVSAAFFLPVIVLVVRIPTDSRHLDAAHDLLLASILGGAVVYASQAKGWLHHSYPLVFFVFLLLCAALSRTRLVRAGGGWARLRVALATVLVGLIALLYSGGFSREAWDDIEARLRKTEGSFLILSTSSFPVFPVAVLENRRLGSRFVNLQLLPAIVNTPADGDDRAAAWEPYLRQSMVEDIARFQPSLVFVPDEDTNLQALPEDFDVLAWFLRDPDFAEQWAHYRAAGRADDFLVYERF